jgi:transposase
MQRRGRPTPQIVLSEEERETLERWARRPKSGQALALRCRIVLAAAEGELNRDIAERLGCNPTTVGKWRSRFARLRLDGLHDEPRPGRARSITDEDVERVITKTLEETPADATHWSTRSMARATGMSQSAVSRIWRAFALIGGVWAGRCSSEDLCLSVTTRGLEPAGLMSASQVSQRSCSR